MGGDSTSETIVIEAGEEREAEHVETTDYFFDKIGESVPLTPNGPSFDLQNPPSQPLAVSEKFRLIFVALSDGFCVAKTADVLYLAKDIKTGRASSSSSSVLDVSIVQVLIGRVSLLSLSSDSSTLAASAAGDIHFFSVKSLLAKEKEPLLSLSIESPNYVKYISWAKERDTSFVVLSNTGTLYSGDLKQPLKHVMDDVEAVGWSVKGEYLAVARKQIVSILTPEFSERKQILLQFKLGFVDANEGAITVDSIQWVRPDCIVVGSLQQTAIGKEENYLVQVITCENGEKIADPSSTPITLCLSDLFLNIVDDIMPFGHGPHLQLSYLETRQLAVLANRKNIDQHIVLVGWLEDTEGPTVVHIERDNWLPRIELQENGEDNVLLAMCIDRVSVYENIEVKLGMDDQRELSPYCIFLCLTHEGKLVIFHFASISGDSGAPSALPSPSDEETISTAGTPDLPSICVEEKEDKIKLDVLDLHSHDMNRDKSAEAEVDQTYFQKIREASCSDKPSTSMPDFDQTLTTGRTSGMWIPTANDQLKPSLSADVDTRLGGGQSGPIVNECVKQISLNSFAGDNSINDAENYNEAEKFGNLRSADYPVGKAFSFSSNLSHGEKSNYSVELDKRLGGEQSEAKENENLKQIPFKSFVADSPKVDAENFDDAEKLKLAGPRSSTDYSVGNVFPFSSNQSQGEKSKNSVELDTRLGGGQSGTIGNELLKQISLKSIAENASKMDADNLNKAENLKLIGPSSATDFSVGKNFSINSNLACVDKLKDSAVLVNRESRSNQPTIFGNLLEQGKTNLSGLSTSSGTMTINAGRATPVPANASMGIHSMQGRGSLLPAKVVSSAPPVNVHLKSPSQSTHSKFESSLSKKYGNIKDMTSELDKLLQCIEEPGGFMDTCTSSQKMLENLEETVMGLFHNCTAWQSLIHEQGETIQHLLDNTVQVLARRIYMEGIVKQTRDKHYRDLWNRQKLSSELQMRRQSMINLSQDLINQLIDLEKHFNTLELNKYGESNGVNLGSQSLRSKHARSRKIQSLHAVHNSLNSQLAAAEQLSDCLSNQMSALSIKSSSVKPDSVKDQLFKMIGIPCESHYETSSPTQNLINTDRPHVTPLFSSATKIGNDSRSNQTSSNNLEPDTVRRRRDSFGQNWVKFEPSKTTIKRMQRDDERPDVQRPSLFMDKRFSISSNADGSVDAGHATHLDLFHDASVEDTSKNLFSRSSPKSSRHKDSPKPSASTINYGSAKQVADKRSLGDFSPDTSTYSGVLDMHVKKETHQAIAERPNYDRTDVENSESSPCKERKTGFTTAQSNQDLQNVQRAQSLVSPFSKITNNMLMSNKINDSPSLKRAGSTVEQNVSSISPSSTLSLSDQPATFSQLATTNDGAQSSKAFTISSTTNFVESAVPVKSPFLVSSPTDQKFSFNIAAGSLNSKEDNQDKFRSATQPTSLSFSLSPSKSTEKAAASSVTSFANSIVKPMGTGSNLSDASSSRPAEPLLSKTSETSVSSPMAFPTISTLKTPNTVLQPFASKVDTGSILQKEPPKNEFGWNMTTLTNSDAPSVAFPFVNSGSDVVSNSDVKKASGVFVFPQTQVSTSEDKTTPDSAVAQDEDEMEEEASSLSLGSLGGLGFGSDPNTTSPFKSNPFGGPTFSTPTAALSPSTNMTVPSGQLFRPASFSFPTQQPPAAQNTGGFNLGTNPLAPSGNNSNIGQSEQMGSGKQALGSVLGSFGQSRQLGPALPSSNFGGGGFGGQPGGGFSAASGGFAAPTGGFAGLSAAGSGFAGAGGTGGGFSSLSTAGGGFSAAAVIRGGGFGAFGNQAGGGGGGGGFGAFGSGSGGNQPPPAQLFTQMRK